ncbi:hypothetical protein N9B94_02030 [Verrucomicrobia bacterium]|nr:hypothetical protein [Verrucomicrobiota bacterium]
MFLKSYITLLSTLLLTVPLSAETLYENDLSKEKVGEEPKDGFILQGDFTIQERDGNKVVSLPGAPLDSHGMLFGPNITEDYTSSAIIYGEKKGRRYPSFGLGINGVGGYRIIISPGKRAIELYRGDEAVAKQGYKWTDKSWTRTKVRITKSAGEEWTITAKAWPKDSSEPKEWQLSYIEKDAPFPGQSSIWGSPFSGKEILFDDLKVVK